MRAMLDRYSRLVRRSRTTNELTLTSSPPQAARIPTAEANQIRSLASVGSSHNRLTSAEDNKEALTFGLSARRSFGRKEVWAWREKKSRATFIPIHPHPERRGFMVAFVKCRPRAFPWGGAVRGDKNHRDFRIPPADLRVSVRAAQ